MKSFVCLAAVLMWMAAAVAPAQNLEAEREAAEAERQALEAERQAAEAEATAEELMRLELEEAQKQLEEAAQEVARLSVELSGGAMQRVVRYFEETGRKAMLGITINDAPDKAGAAAPGVRIYGVSPGGPADEAGLRAGDIIMAINGEPMRGDAHGPADKNLLMYMKTVEPGDALRVEYSRDGQVAQTTVLTEAFEPEAFRFSFDDEQDEFFDFPGGSDMTSFVFRTDDDHHHGDSKNAGHLHLVPMSPGLGAYFGTEHGLLVVRSGGGDTPLQDGDVILSIDGEPVDDVRGVMDKLRFRHGDTAVTLEIVRQRETLSVQIAARDDDVDADRRVTRRIEKRRIDPDSAEIEIIVEEETD